MKKILIDRITVTLQPCSYARPNGVIDSELRICVRTMGEELNLQEIVRADDIESRFDVYFDHLKEQLRTALKKHADAQEPTRSDTGGR